MTNEPNTPKADNRSDDARGFAFAADVTDAALAHAPADFTRAERLQLAESVIGAATAWMRARTLARKNPQ